MYHVDSDRSGTFVVYRERMRPVDPVRLSRILGQAREVLWLTNRPFRADDPMEGTATIGGPVFFRRLLRSGDAVRWDERYYLYGVGLTSRSRPERSGGRAGR
jgi:hypothetical protein